MTYEELLIEADSNNLITKEKPLKAYDGRIRGNKILIRKDMTENKKTCVLAEELGHHYTTTGSIVEQKTVMDRKQEEKARLWAYDKLIGLMGIINAYKAGCHNQNEMANFLEIEEEFLAAALKRYKAKYGIYTTIDNYIIYFEPTISILELHNI